MAKPQEKTKAISLRRSGASIKEIAEELRVSGSTVSRWVSDIQLSSNQKQRLQEYHESARMRGRMAGAQANREKKRMQIRIASEEAEHGIENISSRELFFLGIGLYWGEGTKSFSHSTVTITNSDPKIIRTMAECFTAFYGVERSRFRPRIFINELHRDREQVLLSFWSEELGIFPEQFRKTVFLKKTKKIYENHDTYYGVLALSVAKGGNLRYKIQAQIARVGTLIERRGSSAG